jgi:hypothetical protein
MKELPSGCSKCGGKLVQGFSVEYIIGYGMVGSWLEGEPKKSWQGAKVPPPDQCIPIAHFRCKDCGFLESYARPEFAMK